MALDAVLLEDGLYVGFETDFLLAAGGKQYYGAKQGIAAQGSVFHIAVPFQALFSSNLLCARKNGRRAGFSMAIINPQRRETHALNERNAGLPYNPLRKY